jgi:phosphoribosylformimino-5-aminoimidazole carboxamide ribotide isomerase
VELIPSIDLRAGKVVRLEQGDYARETVFPLDPVETARDFAARGATRLHVVDLDAAREGGEANDAVVRAILAGCPNVPVQVGGGVRSTARVEALLAAGAARVVMGTAALEAPELVHALARRFPDRIVLGLDTRAGKVAVRGWRELSQLSATELLARFESLPLAAVLHTEIERDGLQGGPDVEGTASLARATRIPVLASGGVGKVEDLERLARARVIAGVIVGRALYSGAIRLEDALARIARA